MHSGGQLESKNEESKEEEIEAEVKLKKKRGHFRKGNCVSLLHVHRWMAVSLLMCRSVTCHLLIFTVVTSPQMEEVINEKITLARGKLTGLLGSWMNRYRQIRRDSGQIETFQIDFEHVYPHVSTHVAPM